jgi:peptidoglycan/LPS O-acetylase OafA/YrhL
MLGVVTVGSILFLRESLYRLGGDVLAASAYVTNWFLIIREDSYFEVFGRPPLLQHLWSLSVEEQFYVLWPIIFSVGLVLVGARSKHATIRRFRSLVVVGIVVSTAMMAILFEPFEDPSRVYYGTDTRAAGILIGVALAMWWIPWRLPSVVSSATKRRLGVAGFAALGGLVVILVGLNEFSPWLYRGGFAATSLLTAAVIAIIAHPAVGFGPVLSNPVMRWIGLRSYGIYLWHWPIFMVTRPGLDIAQGSYTTFMIRLGLTFAIAELSYRYVEAPIRKIGYRKWMRQVTGALGIGSLKSATAAAAAVAALFVLVAGILVVNARSGQPGTVVASPSGGGVGLEIPVPVTTTVGDASSDPVDTALQADESTTSTLAVAPPEVVSNETLHVTLIGDSVLKGAEGAVLLELGPGAIVDATVNRQFKHADDAASVLRSNGDLGDIVVIHLGTNGTFSSDAWDEVMGALEDVDRVIVLTAFVPRRWEATVNAAIVSGSERWPGVEIVDYNAFGKAHPEYYNSDGVHLNGSGQAAYAELIGRAIGG